MNLQPAAPTLAASTPEAFESWAIVELMGHRRLAGKVSERVIAGTTLLQVDVPTPDGGMQTQFYGGSAIYCITPTTEEIARSAARHNQLKPVYHYELPAPSTPTPKEEEEEDFFFDNDSPSNDEYHLHADPRMGEDAWQEAHRPPCTIIVNARQTVVEARELSYADVVALAYETPPGGGTVLTVTYRRGEGQAQGCLLPGEAVKVKAGMIFDAVETNKA